MNLALAAALAERPSAVITPATAQNPVAQPSCAGAAVLLTESEARKFGIFDRWQAAMNRKLARQRRKWAATARLNDLVQQLLAIAQREEWSQRKLAAKIGLPESTFRQIRAGKVKPAAWLPVLEIAVARLGRVNPTLTTP